MHDTLPEVSLLMAERHRCMKTEERMRAASAMFDAAREIVASSLPRGLSERAQRLLIAQRIYGDELSRAALEAHAAWEPEEANSSSCGNDEVETVDARHCTLPPVDLVLHQCNTSRVSP